MVDAIAAVMAMEDKEFYKVGELAVAVMIETATAITGDAYKVTRLRKTINNTIYLLNESKVNLISIYISNSADKRPHLCVPIYLIITL